MGGFSGGAVLARHCLKPDRIFTGKSCAECFNNYASSPDYPVPRYYFDTDDGRRKISDEEGADLSDSLQAREEAINIVVEFARDGLLDGDQRTVHCKVRDEAGASVLAASLSLNAAWGSGQKEAGV